MPFKTRYGTHYHMTEGCCGATEPCDTKGLTPCSICCGKGQDPGATTGGGTGTVGGGSPSSGSIPIDSEIVGVSDVTVGGVKGKLYKLDRLLDPDERRAISSLAGAQTVIVVAQYAPEMKRTGVFVEDGYSYSIGRSDEIANAGITALADPVAAPDISLSAIDDHVATMASPSSAKSSDYLDWYDDEDEIPPIEAVDPSDSEALTISAWHAARQEAQRQAKVDRHVAHERAIASVQNDILNSMSHDYDVSDERGYIARQVGVLLDACDIRPIEKGKRDAYTMELASQYVVFAAGHEAYIAGSAADYCASHVMDALEGYEIRLRENSDADEILRRMRAGIDESALYRDREYGTLGGAGVPIFRETYRASELAKQAVRGRTLSQMGKGKRQAMWQADANRWAEMWAASREIRGEGRDSGDVLRSYVDFSSAKNSAEDDARASARKAAIKMSRRYGDAYSDEMGDEIQRAYASAASKALRTLSSRRQMAQQHARLQADALRVVEATRDYDETTPLRSLHPEERRQVALSIVREAMGNRDTTMTDRQRAEAVNAILDGGTIGDIKEITHTDPVSLVDMACAEAVISMRARGQANPRTEQFAR